MGHAILNRLIGLVNKTLKMSFFSFSQFKLGLDQWRPKKRTSLKEDSDWLNILQPRYTLCSELNSIRSLRFALFTSHTVYCGACITGTSWWRNWRRRLNDFLFNYIFLLWKFRFSETGSIGILINTLWSSQSFWLCLRVLHDQEVS